MRVHFFWLNLGCPVGMSIGVSVLSTELTRAGHVVRLTHLSEALGRPLDLPAILADAEEFGASLFALSFGTSHRAHARFLAKALKERFPDRRIICGGVDPSLAAEEVLGFDGVDFVWRGEADGGLFADFVGAIERGNGYGQTPGVWCRESGSIRRNPVAPPPEVSEQAQLNFDLVDYRTITRLRRGFVEVISSRGCPYACTYCQNRPLLGMYEADLGRPRRLLGKPRHRTVANLLAELREFLRRVGEEGRGVSFADDAFATDRRWLQEFEQSYPRQIGLPFVCCVDLNHCDEETCRTLRAAGCFMVKFGLECGSERINRKILRRPFTTTKAAAACGMFRRHDINTRAYVMFGLPTETPAEMLQTFELCGRLQVDSVRPAVYLPSPSTELFEFCRENGLLSSEDAPSTYFGPSVLRMPPETALFIDKLRIVFPWVMSASLDSEGAEAFRPLVQKVVGMSREEWERDGTREWAREIGRDVSGALMSRKVPHYFTPFEERPDACFLFRERENAIINIDG